MVQEKKEGVGREKRDFSFPGNLTGNRGREKDERSGEAVVQGALVCSVDSHSGVTALLSAESTRCLASSSQPSYLVPPLLLRTINFAG